MAQINDIIKAGNGLLQASMGNVPDCQTQNIFGFNRVIGTTYETVHNAGGLYVYPSSAVQMSVVSTSASDTMTLVINGLDDSYNQLSEIVTLNGTTAVTTSNSFYRINSAAILSGQNAGNISISNGGTTYGYIEAGIGITQALNFTVPAGWSLYLYRLTFTSGTVNPNKYLVIRNHLESSNGRVLNVAEMTMQNGVVTIDRQIPFRIEEKTDFSFLAKSSSGENELSVFSEVLLARNGA